VQAAVQAAQLPAAVVVRADGLEPLPAVLAAQQGLVLVLVNLLANAAEAMQDHGTW